MVDSMLELQETSIRKLKELEKIIDNIPATIYLKDKDDNFIYVNQKFAERYKKPKEYFEGRNLHDFNNNDALRSEDELQFSDINNIPLFDKYGYNYRVLGFSINKLDSIEFNAIESGTKLKKVEEKYRDLYEEVPNAYFSIGNDKPILRCNKVAVRLLGYSKEELLKMKVCHILFNSGPNWFFNLKKDHYTLKQIS